MKRARGGKPKPAAAGEPAKPPKARRVVFRDLTVYGRNLKLPAFATSIGMSALAKAEVSNDFRLIAGLPQLKTVEEAEEDSLLADTKKLSPEIRAKLGQEPPEPEPPVTRSDERPQVIQALETAAFDDADADEEEAATILEPSRVMSGWVAARVLGESASSASLAPGRTVLVDGAPGLFAAPALASAVSAAALINSGSSSSGSSGGVTGGAYISGLSGGTPAHLSGGQQLQPAGGTAVGAGRTTAGAAGSGATAPWGPEKTGLPPHYHPLGGAAGSHGVDPTIAAGGAGVAHPHMTSGAVFAYGSTHGSGIPVGLGPLRLDLGLKDRLAALASRREERDKRFIALRRHYVDQLRAYHLQSKEHMVALEALKEEVEAAKEAASAATSSRGLKSSHNAKENGGALPTLDVAGGPGYLNPRKVDTESDALAVARLVQCAQAVMRQNLQLRARLAQATGRASGADVDASEPVEGRITVPVGSSAAALAGFLPLPACASSSAEAASAPAAAASKGKKGGRGSAPSSASPAAHASKEPTYVSVCPLDMPDSEYDNDVSLLVNAAGEVSAGMVLTHRKNRTLAQTLAQAALAVPPGAKPVNLASPASTGGAAGGAGGAAAMPSSSSSSSASAGDASGASPAVTAATDSYPLPRDVVRFYQQQQQQQQQQAAAGGAGATFSMPSSNAPGGGTGAKGKAAAASAAASDRMDVDSEDEDDDESSGGGKSGDGSGSGSSASSEFEDASNPFLSRADGRQRLGGSTAARRPAYVAAAPGAKPTLFALGDLVATPYGRGVVIRQRDDGGCATDVSGAGMVTVRLRWAARAYLHPSQLSLLALAGETFLGAERDDVLLLPTAPFGTAPTGASAGTGAAGDVKVPSTSDVDRMVLEAAASSKGGKKGKPAAPSTPSRGPAPGAKSRLGATTSLADGLHHGHSAAELEAEVEEESAAALRATRKIKTRSGVPITNRICVFRTSWGTNGAPRVTPLRIDPYRGASGAGYIVGTADGLGDSLYFGRNGTGAPPKAAPAVVTSQHQQAGASSAAATAGAGSSATSGFLPASTAASAAAATAASAPFSSSSFAGSAGLDTLASPLLGPAAGLGGAGAGAGGFSADVTSLGAMGSPATAAAGGGLAGSMIGGGGSGLDMSASPLHLQLHGPAGSAAHGALGHGGGHGASVVGRPDLARMRGELTRLTFQLRVSEESRREQRQRLTDARLTASALLAQLNEARSTLEAVSGELVRKDGEVTDLSSRITRLYERFAPEAERKTWEQLRDAARAAAAAASSSSSAIVAAGLSSAVGDDGGEESEADVTAAVTSGGPAAKAGAAKGRAGARGAAAAKAAAAAAAAGPAAKRSRFGAGAGAVPPPLSDVDAEDDASDGDEETDDVTAGGAGAGGKKRTATGGDDDDEGEGTVDDEEEDEDGDDTTAEEATAAAAAAAAGAAAAEDEEAAEATLAALAGGGASGLGAFGGIDKADLEDIDADVTSSSSAAGASGSGAGPSSSGASSLRGMRTSPIDAEMGGSSDAAAAGAGGRRGGRGGRATRSSGTVAAAPAASSAIGTRGASAATRGGRKRGRDSMQQASSGSPTDDLLEAAAAAMTGGGGGDDEEGGDGVTFSQQSSSAPTDAVEPSPPDVSISSISSGGSGAGGASLAHGWGSARGSRGSGSGSGARRVTVSYRGSGGAPVSETTYETVTAQPSKAAARLGLPVPLAPGALPSTADE